MKTENKIARLQKAGYIVSETNGLFAVQDSLDEDGYHLEGTNLEEVVNEAYDFLGTQGLIDTY